MEKTPYNSYKNGTLCKGCELCVKGKKLVLFITGTCTRSCYFCPISEQKYHQDVIYANERPIKELKEMIEEAKLCSARGAGITGGDPLTRLDRTIEAIKLLKKEFNNFHIHLYTPLELVTQEIITKLEQSGLDEIRFHLDLDDDKLWKRIEVKTKMSKGIEIPCIPNKDIKKLIEFVKDKVNFINLNELEYSDAEHNKLAELGFTLRDDYSYGIEGSEQLALEMLESFPNLNIHYCTTKLKDGTQMMNRLKLRAQNIKHDFDILTEDATLLRGAILGENVKEKQSQLPFKTIYDETKDRLLCAKTNIKKFSSNIKKLNLKGFIVEELPTYNFLEIESEEI